MKQKDKTDIVRIVKLEHEALIKKMEIIKEDRIEELEMHIVDLRMAFITALDLIETYKK